MTLKKYADSPKEGLIKIKNVVDFIKTKIQEDYPEAILGKFSALIWFEDLYISFEDLDELVLELPLLVDKKVLNQYSITFEVPTSKDKYIEHIRIEISGVKQLSISCDSRKSIFTTTKVEKLIDNVFSEVLNTCRVYKYDDQENKKQKVSELKIKCVNILNSLSTLQLRLKESFKDEVEFQSFLWPILRSHFSDLEDEQHMPKYAGTQSKPDFGIPSARLLIEAKFSKKNSDFKRIKEEIHDDIHEYFVKGQGYDDMIVVIYNSPYPDKYMEDLERNTEIFKVIITPGINPV